MQANPIWPVKKRFPKLDKTVSTDVVIVGGGITGLSSAYHLAQYGNEVVVLEQDEIGSAASGASSGFIYYGNGINLLDAISHYGEKNAFHLWTETKDTIDWMELFIQKERLECGFRQPGALIASKSPEQTALLEKEKNLLKKVGVKGESIDGKEYSNYFTGRKFHSGLLIPKRAQFRPAQYGAAIAENFDIQVYENSPFQSYERTTSGITVSTPGGKVNCEKLVFASNLSALFGLEKFYRPESSIIIASKPLSESKMKKIWPNEKLMWTLEAEYDMIYPEDSRLILEVFNLKNFKQKLTDYYPTDFVVDTQYGESWGKSKDELPIVGEAEKNVYVGIAVGDQGTVIGSTIGKKMPYLLEGKKDKFLEMCSHNRFK